MTISMPRLRTALLAIAAMWAAAFLVALTAPDTVLRESALARGVVEAVSWAVPIGTTTIRSAFPEVSVLYFSIAWLSFPFWLIVVLKWLGANVGKSQRGLLFKTNLSLANRFVLIVLIPIWIGLAYAAFAWNHGGDVRLFSIGGSRLQLGLFGMCIPFAAASALGLALFSIWRLLLPTNQTGSLR